MGNNILFHKLTPTNAVDMDVYEDAFKYFEELLNQFETIKKNA